MKFQKTILLPLLAILFLCLSYVACDKNSEKITEKSADDNQQKHFDLIIGKIQNGKIVFTYDLEKVKSDWINKVTPGLGFTPDFAEIQIIKENANYSLVAKDIKNNATSVISLVIDNGNLYEQRSTTGGGKTVTCSGCKSTGPGSGRECIPKDVDKPKPYCSHCSYGDCEKTVTVSTDNILGGNMVNQ